MSEHNISGKKSRVPVTDGVEQMELTSPWNAVKEAGGEPTLVSPRAESCRATTARRKARRSPSTSPSAEADAADFHALVIPGGVVNADHLRVDKDAQAFARAFFEQHKPVASICHGPWLLIDAGVVSGRNLTSYHTLQTDLKNAGANWTDEQVVVDQGLVTSRTPTTFRPSTTRLLEEIAEGEHAGQTA